jgi:pyruvate,water dikinase
VSGDYVVALEAVPMRDVARVGGKNATLGERLQHLSRAGVRAVGGFATEVSAYAEFLTANDLGSVIESAMTAYGARRLSLDETGKRVRDAMLAAVLPPPVADAIRQAYRNLAQARGERAPAVAVRSSATAEDLPQASFAGQQETYLNVRGEAALLDAVRSCFASLYTDRAISYRENNRIDQVRVALSAGVQPMVRSDRGGAGVMFSVDTETGFPGVVVISASYGLGETVVQGSVDPDSIASSSRCSSTAPADRRAQARQQEQARMQPARGRDDLRRTTSRRRRAFIAHGRQVLELARALSRSSATTASRWTWSGRKTAHGELYVLQARPETVQAAARPRSSTYKLKQAGRASADGRGRRRGDRDGLRVRAAQRE